MTNLLKAEKTLNFPNDKTYQAKMSLDTIMGIESALNSSILAVANKLSGGGLTLTDIITIITLSVRAGGNNVKDADVKELISEIGLVKAVENVGDLLTMALTSDSEQSDEKKSQA